MTTTSSTVVDAGAVVDNVLVLRSDSDGAGHEIERWHCCFVLVGGTNAGGLNYPFDLLTDR